ncbi:MAG TPA: hypothetical protein VFZ00_04985 [Solirubrobacter sp.]|nr:hypothetical protein [Solirubrobacter sp.]
MPTIEGMLYTSFAATSWPDAAVAIAGTALVGTVIVTIVWQTLATWRARITVAREQAYQRLAEETARRLDEIEARLP